MHKPALLVIDHGSRRAAANDALESLAKKISGELGPEWIVRYAHMELAPPTIAEAFCACVEAGATEIVVHPFMLSPGRHVVEDIPRLVAEAALATPVPYSITAPVGLNPGISGIIANLATSSQRATDEG